MILVTGATGQVGYQLLERLADVGEPATAMVGVDAEGIGLPAATPYLVGSLEAPPPAQTLREFDRVFLVSPTIEAQVAAEIAFIDALVAAGHRPRLVKVAADGFQEPDCEVRFMRGHRQIAVHLERVDLPVTYLAPNVYLETLLSAADTIRRQGLLAAPAGAGKVGFVATEDVAAVAADALTQDRDDGVRVVIGPESLGYADVADRISAVFARRVDYDDVPPERARQAMLADGVDPWEVEGRLELFDWIRNGGCDVVTDEVARSTGDLAVPIEHWLTESRAAFLGPPEEPPRF